MPSFKESVTLHGVEIQVSGTYEPAEPQSWGYPGSNAEVNVSTYKIGGIEVSNLIDAADWYEEVNNLILAAVGELELA